MTARILPGFPLGEQTAIRAFRRLILAVVEATIGADGRQGNLRDVAVWVASQPSMVLVLAAHALQLRIGDEAADAGGVDRPTSIE